MVKKAKLHNRYIVLAILCVCEIMYLLPYLRWTFYTPMIEAFGFTNTQIASLGSIFGFLSVFGYILGGPICDRFSPRKILISAFLMTAIGGIWFALYPPYWACVIIHIIWGIATSVLLWDCMIRVTRSLASDREQGVFFGVLEGGRGGVDTVASFMMVAVFAALGESVLSLRKLILLISGMCIIGAMLVYIFISDKVSEIQGDTKIRKDEIVEVLKKPAVWLIAVVIMCNYSIFTGGTYLTSYLSDIMGVGITVTAVIAIFRNYVLMMFGGPIGGLLGDRFSISTVIITCFGLIAISMCVFIVLPSGTGLGIAVIMMMVLYLGLFLMRGIYFGTVDEVGIPMRITGTAVGIISVIGFIPEVFMNTLSGFLLDKYPGYKGYHYLFIVLFVFALMGGTASIYLKRTIINTIK